MLGGDAVACGEWWTCRRPSHAQPYLVAAQPNPSAARRRFPFPPPSIRNTTNTQSTGQALHSVATSMPSARSCCSTYMFLDGPGMFHVATRWQLSRRAVPMAEHCTTGSLNIRTPVIGVTPLPLTLAKLLSVWEHCCFCRGVTKTSMPRSQQTARSRAGGLFMTWDHPHAGAIIHVAYSRIINKTRGTIRDAYRMCNTEVVYPRGKSGTNLLLSSGYLPFAPWCTPNRSHSLKLHIRVLYHWKRSHVNSVEYSCLPSQL